MISLAFALFLAQGAANAGPQYHASDDKIVCRYMIMEAGTKIPARVCRTHAEWEAIYRQTQDDMHSSRNKTLGCNPTDPRRGC